jgi:dTDP-glucose 4,6-dehydratase
MAQEKFLVLGASSFYGSNFAKYAEERGEEVYRYSRHLWHLGDYIGVKVDYIVNFASMSLVAESWDTPYDWIRTNAADTTTTFQQADGMCKKFVHVSTPEVYGSHKGWIGERCAFNPSTPYAVSRAAADMMLMAYYRAYGFPGIITRTANIYGEGQKEPRIIPLAMRHKKEGKPLSLHGGGSTVRGFIHVKDACEATYLICKQGVPGETYHIAPKNVLPIRELVRMIGCEIGEDIPDRLGKDRSYMMDSSKLRGMGWTDKIRLGLWVKN